MTFITSIAIHDYDLYKSLQRLSEQRQATVPLLFYAPLVIEHLPGKHDQMTHGHGGGGGSSRGGTSKKSKSATTTKAASKSKTEPAKTNMTGSAKHADLEAFRNEVSGDPSSEHGDEQLSKILSMQGFDGKPQLVDDAELDEHVKQGEVEVLRGVERSFGGSYAKQFQEGELYAGRGVFGNGTYTAKVDPHAGYRDSAQHVAWYYAGHRGEVLRMTIKADAKVGEYDTLVQEMKTEIGKLPMDSNLRSVASDVGRYAAMKGYDVVHIGSNHGNGANNAEQYLVLNRTATRVSKTIRSQEDMKTMHL